MAKKIGRPVRDGVVMPAPVLIIHQQHDICKRLLGALRAAGYEAVSFSDPMTALDAIEADSCVRVLVTGVNFGAGKLNGVALARMLRTKRRVVKVVFVGQPADDRYIDGEGEFVPYPIDPETVAEAVGRGLADTGEGII